MDDFLGYHLAADIFDLGLASSPGSSQPLFSVVAMQNSACNIEMLGGSVGTRLSKPRTVSQAQEVRMGGIIRILITQRQQY